MTWPLSWLAYLQAAITNTRRAENKNKNSKRNSMPKDAANCCNKELTILVNEVIMADAHVPAL
jgi:hypothetical protein